ncbi:MAG: PLDc N-terminal domain-containing protein [Oscillospiraceae bacterium]|nr:PLDc N-terminal domain-containing protein [Oscillospiraceae bacterium]
MDDFLKFIPFIIPLVVIQLGFVIFCVFDIQKKKKTKNLSPVIWILLVVVLMNTFIGPVLYIIFGKAENSADDDI